MAVKHTLLGLLIYVALGLYVSALLAHAIAFWLRRAKQRPAAKTCRQIGEGFFAGGFLVAAFAVGLRWVEVRHAPLQNLFEVFMVLGAVVYPLSLFCRRFLDTNSPAADAFLAAFVLVPSGFVFNAEVQHLPPALQSWLFIPHVSVYMLAYVILFMAAWQGLCQIAVAAGMYFRGPNDPTVQWAEATPSANPALLHERAAYRLVKFGFPLLTLGLVLGAVWGKLAWGDYWNWDPKELWSFVTFLIYVLYLHVRYMFPPPPKNAGRRVILLGSLAVLGALAIVITLLWVNLGRIFGGMHSYATS